jgi:hypothetical protein
MCAFDGIRNTLHPRKTEISDASMALVVYENVVLASLGESK